MIEIVLLYFDGCPSWKSALENLHKALDSEQIQARVSLLKIDSPEQAQQEHFLGSPSIRVNGVDLWPEERTNYALSCRVYRTPSGMEGSPTVEMLRERFREAISISENPD
jgi:hypothetical protein